MADQPKYPNISVQLSGRDGNAYAIMGAVTAALRTELREEMTPAEQTKLENEFIAEATSGDYDHLLRTCMKWVEVE